MKEYDLNQLLNNPTLVEQKISEFIEKRILNRQPVESDEVEGHIEKAEHNLRFVAENVKIGFLDWAITGCYYACYHAALALILTRGYSSKNHLATLCTLIKEFYSKELDKEDIEVLSSLLDYQDLLFYVESKNKRKDATYSTKSKFDNKKTEQLRIKAALFVSKTKTILER
ncbi:HEPN domain-containing protein [Candidatus Woesearchaeota archaeon]|nr:HEPN domain-containing protein [Candidatus Woesearchaeota archaeon]